MNKFVIYSAIIGQYDHIAQPTVIDDRFDYVLFSDCIPEGKIGVWQVKKIEYTNPVQPKIARFVKTHPELLLPEYDASLWMDANIIIASNYVYNRFFELYQSGVSLASVKHPGYDCVYDEMFSVLDFLYESEKVVLIWGQLLRKRGFPRHAGMFETGLLFRIHSKAEIGHFDSAWWSYIEKYSQRDQLSFTVAIRDSNQQCECFVPAGYSVCNHPGFIFVQHANETIKFAYNDGKAWLMRHYHKHHEDKELVASLYYWIYRRRCPMLWAKVIGQYYRVIDRLR